MQRPESNEFTRRSAIAGALTGGVGTALAALPTTRALGQSAAQASQPSVRFCFNTSTIRGQKLSVAEQIKVVGEAGYDGIEPWIGDLQKHVEAGGKLADLRKQLGDQNLRVESAIGFASWIVDDASARKKGLESAKRDMEMVAELGGTRIAAPPVGATREPGLSLAAAAERYAALLETGRTVGVTPQLELWGFSKNLSRLGELLYVASEAGHPDACVLPDVYHIYKGGSDFAGLQMIAGKKIHCFHMNDYPNDPPREKIGDADRVYPGDGVAPLTEILSVLFDNGFRGALSLELFNRDYWKQDPMTVATTGLKSMRAAVAKAVAHRERASSKAE